ncbi:MAG: SUF system NifU family Fe-S cluster assembly protein [Chloroflexi bacterium]|nr:SUF system NifU family Fe-S cluster assembly protein [Chloroflexota bacterium]
MYDLRDLYQEIVVDHSRRPRNFGELEEANRTAEGFNPLCGDQLTIYLKVSDRVVTDVKFVGTGCAISKASASMMTEEIKGKTVEDIESIFESFRRMVTRKHGEDFDSSDLGDLEILSGVSEYPARIKCATLSWHAMQAALSDKREAVSTE